MKKWKGMLGMDVKKFVGDLFDALAILSVELLLFLYNLDVDSSLIKVVLCCLVFYSANRLSVVFEHILEHFHSKRSRIVVICVEVLLAVVCTVLMVLHFYSKTMLGDIFMIMTGNILCGLGLVSFIGEGFDNYELEKK